MKKIKFLCVFVMIVFIIFIPFAVNAEQRTDNLKSFVNFYTYADVSKHDTRINTSYISGVDTLVLPAVVSDSEVVLFCDSREEFRVKGALNETSFVSGQSLDLTMLCNKGDYVLEFRDATSVYTIRFLFLGNIPSLYLLSETPGTKGRIWVDSSTDKSNKAKGTMVMLDENGEVVHRGNLTQIKGRGNTTWGLPKKPYQIKLEDKADLICTGEDSNKSKTWVLLANYLDPVGVRNTLALNLGSALDMPVNVQGKSIDLYYDGEYRGMYMLTEKVEVGEGRVAISDLEEENKKVNPDMDFDVLPVAEGLTENGASYTYCEGMISPQDISGGYLLEMDYKVRALEEKCYICTSRGNYVVVKSPEYASEEEMDYIATMYQEYEDAVFEGGINPKTNKKYSDYIDVRSLACYYLINEFSKSRDCFCSSAYLTKKAGEDKFIMGPLWDYDMSFGKGSIEDYYINDNSLGFSVINSDMGKALFGINDFFDVMKEIYINDFKPLIKDIILGNVNAVSKRGGLHSLEYYRNTLKDSAQCNSSLWYETQSWPDETEILYDFVSQRYDVLTEYFEIITADYELGENCYYDVLTEDWFYDAVTRASSNSLLNGVGNGFFMPNSYVKRSHAAQVIFNLSNNVNAEYNSICTDVNVDDWYNDAVVWTVTKGFMSGYPDGTFRPDDFITREDFVNALYKFSGSPVVETNLIYSFADRDLITCANAVEWAIKRGIIRGADNFINPQSTMSRAEMAAILVRYCDVYDIQ